MAKTAHPQTSQDPPCASTPRRSVGGVLSRALGRILRRVRHQRQDPHAAIIASMSDAEYGALLGSSWAAMTPDQRERYPEDGAVIEPVRPDGRHDEPGAVVRLVRPDAGPTIAIVLRGAVSAWILRRRHLVPSDID